MHNKRGRVLFRWAEWRRQAQNLHRCEPECAGHLLVRLGRSWQLLIHALIEVKVIVSETKVRREANDRLIRVVDRGVGFAE